MKKILFITTIILVGFCLNANPIKELIKNAGDVSEYPDDDLLIIFDSVTVDVKETGLSFVNTHRLYKILTFNGALDINVIKYDYDPLSAYVEIRKVIIHRKDGQTELISRKKVLDYPAPARMIYWGARQKMVEVGRLEPGDAVEVFLFRKGFTYALLMDDDDKYIPPMRGHFYDIIEFWSDDPIQLKVYKVTVPKSKQLQYEFYNGEVQSSIHFRGEKTIYTFTKKNITPFEGESGMVSRSDVAPKLLMSTSPNWNAKSLWFYGVNEDYGSFETTPEITTKVKKILIGAKTEMDSVSRLTHWVADEIRYSGISMGPGEGYTLHNGEMNFTDRCGVCKDKAGMLITMLRAAGFKSYPAMTMAGSRIDYIPADQFNHSVTLVKLSDGKYHLLDPTWVPFVRELWSSAEQQQNYLMGIPEGADLSITPLSPPENHYVRITGTSEILLTGTLEGEFTFTAEGQSDASVRRMFTGDYKIMWERNVEQELLKISPLFEIIEMDFGTPYDYMKEPITIKIKYRIPEFARVTEDEIIFTPLVASGIFERAHYHLYHNVNLKERKYNFKDRCSRLVELKETIKVPEYKTVAYMPETASSEGSGASFDGGYKIEKNVIVLKEKAIFKKRIYTPEDWPSYREAVVSQSKFAKEPVILKRK